MTYDPDAPPGTYDHTSMLGCVVHGESSVHFKLKGGLPHWNCVACALAYLECQTLARTFAVKYGLESGDLVEDLGHLLFAVRHTDLQR